MVVRLRPRSALRAFLQSGASGGLVLMAAAVAAMVVANSSLSDSYFRILSAHVGPLSVLHWIDDALMSLFFLLVGLEIKRELVDGHLASWSDRVLPTIAAASGMAVPAIVYLAIAGSTPGLARGWAIPSATDIAFAIGVMALLGKRVPASLKLFLTTVAIVDDMGAVAVIALAYTREISGLALLAAVVTTGVMFILNRWGVVRLLPYLLLALVLWAAVWMSGIHATIAGVVTAALIPIRRSPGAPDAAGSPLHRLEHGLQPWVAYAIVPLFGFANAGVSLAGFGISTLLTPLPLGIAAGLLVGKQVGVLGAVYGAVRLGWVNRPGGASWVQVYGTALLCGIGFTMSLFIGGLAFTDATLERQVKLGVLAGSILSALAGSCVLYLGGRHRLTPPEDMMAAEQGAP
ncbi:Na+/H+ antiporter NhaA [Sphingomonas sp. KR1UV-12]|uniref:Na(+)/H(+) antiporter NhaA n=1 Tax=Sphingomonas aurea TaxID=3063994 RepID=A0ABT9EJ25_9SPHN|nr:Na+/H+ antiporter NhaA [Sphingomonas sp. KR1UV-12]MDP1026821.1 Na+/H+ antiporter NhaA [Sphingomonas sp. KR1UV-12]